MSAHPQVVPGAEPFSFDGGPSGVLLLHGFTGNPSSMRPLGKWLAARGHAVEGPRFPGHGTHWRDLGRYRWQDWEAEGERALDRLAEKTQGLVVCGLSMGGVMALHLAVKRPDVVNSLVLVNPFPRDRRIALLPYIWPLVPAQKGVGNDIAKEAANEIPYERIPARAIGELAKLLRVTAGEIPAVKQPVLVLRSPQDHVVRKGAVRWMYDRLTTKDKEMVELPNSYHVATLDHDAEIIFERTHEMAQRAVTTPAGG
ncbi:MAG: alpha/beta hydrolase [Actinomycetota bacterium]